ncbi:J domain-containing protein [Neobacillus ginsengisoli]|uniref:Regulator of replication initiation timing n=1 Tax=Neobacillus ginsengisoli TaxID=904295 RepID=A0ABT9XWC7_9BACI|nr:J domain-containing protein [Neobacillus ginsengisoli]MDQ0199796.1 regulator of replication initiation timing [Neobacillus ginsengisoli]
MNTDQAFELLKEAGLTEDSSIQTVRRWLRERKINYEGTGPQKTGYILDDTDQAYNMLKDAGVAESFGVQIVQRWLSEGKIQNVGTGNQKPEYRPIETTSKRLLNNSTDQDKIICQLKVRIKAQDEHIKGIEQLHRTSINTLTQQRDKLNREIVILENEVSELQRETKKLLKENIDLHNELLKLKEEFSKGNTSNPEKTQASSPPKKIDYRQKLGLSKAASHKEVLAGYKNLLKITHPDHGGNATAFHYVKTDYDFFRNSIKGE